MIACSASIFAQTPMYVDVSQCRDIKVDLVRVACYDTLADQARGRLPPQVPVNAIPQTQEQTDPNRQILEENWRMREELARLRKGQASGGYEAEQQGYNSTGRSTIEQGDDGSEFYSRITALQKIPDGWIVTLANGQVWRQKDVRKYNLREGQEVRIYPTGWGGSYRLAASGLSGFIQVDRVR